MRERANVKQRLMRRSSDKKIVGVDGRGVRSVDPLEPKTGVLGSVGEGGISNPSTGNCPIDMRMRIKTKIEDSSLTTTSKLSAFRSIQI